MSAGEQRREWVVGFLFDLEVYTVVLIRKNRPEWQAGRLNGVGGKIEPKDRQSEAAILTAMEREFLEETGLLVLSADWHHYASLSWEQGVVHFLRSFAAHSVLRCCRSVTDEQIEFHRIHELLEPGPLRAGVTPNLLWLVPLAAHRHDDYDVIDVVETGTTMRKPGRLDVLPGSRADGLPPAVARVTTWGPTGQLTSTDDEERSDRGPTAQAR